MVGILLFCVLIGILWLIYRQWLAVRNHWKERGLPQVMPYPLVGNMMPFVLRKKTIGEVLKDLGDRFSNEPIVGVYNFTKACVLINDPEYAEIVLIKEFSSFMDRSEPMKMADKRPLDKHLFFITGSEWKAIRSKLSPVFTTGKLKDMLQNIEQIFQNTFDEMVPSSVIDLKDLIELSTLRVRASCVFGIDLANSRLENQFLENVKRLSKSDIVSACRTTIALWAPKVATMFNISIFGAEAENYFTRVLFDSFRQRTESKVSKNDFMQTLLELKTKGKIEVKQWTEEDEFLKHVEHQTSTTVAIDDDVLLSQSFIFLLAGLDPLLSTLSMLFVELSQRPQVLNKLREEIDTVISKNKQFSYQALKEMEYLDLCIKETLRLYTPAEMNVRYCLKTFTFPNGFTLEKGTDAFIPTSRFHMDPEIFPDPFEFRPERFENYEGPSGAYLPFGQGPRICIGMRFAVVEMKMFVSKLLFSYDIKLNPKTKVPVEIDKWFFLRRHNSPIFMNMDKRQSYQ